MSTTVDERVVSMQFDNKHFESNVKTTMSTLDKLKESLKFKNASKGMDGIAAAARKCDISPLGKAAETVNAKFSAMEVIGVTALANITNSAVNYGKRIVSALTIDPIKTGFSEYETKINAIQTIMSNTVSKGTTMDDVTKALGDLNTYADKTIYFGPMGCRTGFYLLLAGDYSSSDIVPLMVEMYEFIRDFEGEVPGASARDCGNYLDMNLNMAKYLSKKYLDNVLYGIGPDRLNYPNESTGV